MNRRTVITVLLVAFLASACGPVQGQTGLLPVPVAQTSVASGTEVPYQEPGEPDFSEVTPGPIPTPPTPLPEGTPEPTGYYSIELDESGIPVGYQVWTYQKPLQSAVPLALTLTLVQPEGPGELAGLFIFTAAGIATLYYLVVAPQTASLEWQGIPWDTSHLKVERTVYLAAIFGLGWAAVKGCQHNNNTDGRGTRTRIFWSVPRFIWGHGAADEITWIFNETQPTFSTVMPRNASVLQGFEDIPLNDPRCMNAFEFLVQYVLQVFGGPPPIAPAQ